MVRFPTSALLLRKNIEALRQKKRPIYLTMEASAFTRWASGDCATIGGALDHLRTATQSSHQCQSDQERRSGCGGDVFASALGKLKEVWMGQDRTREIYRALVYELLNWRDAQRELSAHQGTLPRLGRTALHGIKVFSLKYREDYLRQLPEKKNGE